MTPLAFSTGAGAGSQNDIGTGVIGGMTSATVLTIFFVPLFLCWCARYSGASVPKNGVQGPRPYRTKVAPVVATAKTVR